MIIGLYEVHLFVEDLERSIDFYSKVLGLQQCYYGAERRAAFFWIGKPRQSFLGLWEKPKEEIDMRHFAFECDPGFVLNESIDFLKRNHLQSGNFLNDGTAMPMVFAWMPAVSVYFDDADGHSLEFIGILKGKPGPERGVISYDEWLRIEKSEE